MPTLNFESGSRMIDGDLLNAYMSGAAPHVNIVTTGFQVESVAAGLTATGNNRATALPVNTQVVVVTTTPAGSGIVLPVATSTLVGAYVTVFNNGGNPLQVYGNKNDTIDGVAGATGVPLTNLPASINRCQYFVLGVGAWTSAKMGLISS